MSNELGDELDLTGMDSQLAEDRSSATQAREQLTQTIGTQPDPMQIEPFNAQEPVNHMQDMMKGAPMLMLLAALGGKASGLSGTAMLSGVNGMMSGLTDGNHQAYQESVDKFKGEYAQWKDRQALKAKVYSEYLTAYKGRVDAAQKAAEAAGRAVGDDIRDKNNVIRNFQAEQRLTGQMANYASLIEKRDADIQKEKDKHDPALLENRAKLIANYQMPPPTSYEAGRNPAGFDALMQQVTALNPGYQANEYAARTKAYKDFATGKQGQQAQSFGVALAHLDTLQKLVDALDNGDTKQLTRLKIAWQRETGNPAPGNFDTAKKIVVDEIVKAIVPTGGGVVERQEAASHIAATGSPAALYGVIGTYKDLLAGQIGGLAQTFKHSTGRDDFESILTPLARKYYDDHRAEIEQTALSQPQEESPPPAPQSGAPPVGTIKGGYEFMGGEASKRENWRKVKPQGAP